MIVTVKYVKDDQEEYDELPYDDCTKISKIVDELIYYEIMNQVTLDFFYIDRNRYMGHSRFYFNSQVFLYKEMSRKDKAIIKKATNYPETYIYVKNLKTGNISFENRKFNNFNVLA